MIVPTLAPPWQKPNAISSPDMPNSSCCHLLRDLCLPERISKRIDFLIIIMLKASLLKVKFFLSCSVLFLDHSLEALLFC